MSTPQAQDALHDYLLRAYEGNIAALIRLIGHLTDGDQISSQVPPIGLIPAEELLWQIQDWLNRKGLVNQDLFDRLVKDRPLLEGEIRKVQRQFQRIVLFLSAAPEGAEPVKVEEEAKAIIAAIRASFGDRDMGLVVRHGVEIPDWRREIDLIKPEILHFCGHGSLQSLPVLLNEDGGPVEPPLEPLLAQLLRSGIQGAIFNACVSSRLAQTVVEQGGLRWAIGADRAIIDETAIAFAEGFYEALSQGKAPRDAYEAGKERCAWDRLLSDLLVFVSKS